MNGNAVNGLRFRLAQLFKARARFFLIAQTFPDLFNGLFVGKERHDSVCRIEQNGIIGLDLLHGACGTDNHRNFQGAGQNGRV